MRRVWNYAVGAIEFITNDEGENPDFLLFPATVPDSAINVHDGYAPLQKPAVDAVNTPSPLLGLSNAPSASTAVAAAKGPEPRLPPVFKPPVPSDQNYTPESFTKYVRALANYQSNLNQPHIQDDNLVDLEQNAFNALRNIAQALVWADQRPNKSTIWDLFLELSVMNLFVKCLKSSSQYSSIESRYACMRYQSNFLRTLSIIIQSVTLEKSLYSLFSTNYINRIIEFEFEFQNEEILGYYISALKSISLKLNPPMLQFFYDPKSHTFPIFTSIVSFFDHPESMTRIAVRNITLNIFNIPDSPHLEFVLQNTSYLPRLFNYLKTLCGSVARALELILDDGIEIPRNRKRTGIFRKKVKLSDVSVRLSEIENILLYLNDLFDINSHLLKSELKKLISSTLFAPLFRPIASRASLDISASQVLTPFDAAARVSLFTFMVNHAGDSPGLMSHILSEISRPNRAFDNRTILNGLKSMVSDLEGTEKVSYIALKAIEAVISAKRVSPHLLHSLQLGFESGDYSQNDGNGIEGHTNTAPPNAFNQAARLGSFPESIADDEPVLMTLTDFEAPLTPFVSLPSTPKTSDANLQPPSPFPNYNTPPVDGDVEPPNTNALKKSTQADETMNEEDILNLFKSGETSLKDTISAALLVVRRKEARSFRLIESVSKVILITTQKGSTYLQAMHIIAQIVEVLAGSLKEYLNHPKVTPQLIDEAFHSYQKASLDDSSNCANGHALPEIVFTSEQLARSAFGGDPSKRKHSSGVVSSTSSSARLKSRLFAEEAFTPPVEYEDALVLFVIVQTFEKLHAKAYQRSTSLEWHSEMQRVVRSIDEEDNNNTSYEVKKEKLIEMANIALKTQPST